MRKFALLATAVLLLAGARVIQLMAPSAQIVVQGVSPQELVDRGWKTGPSSGLDVVGRGEVVYLSGREAAGEAASSYSWTLTGPSGSTAQLDSTDTEWTTFRPDLAGKYTVGLTITTASGTTSATTVITAAEYVSVGAVDGKLFPDVRKGQCAGCHSGHYESWTETGHGTYFKRAIDGLINPRYGAACIKCHTNGYNDDPQAVNGGFDDIARDLGWTFPTTLQLGNWDNLIATAPSLAKAAGIQCESCHGPGSQHKGDVSGIDISLNESVCGRCHDEQPKRPLQTQWKNSGHAIATSSPTDRAECAECHSGYGFIAKVDPQSNLRQKTGSPAVSCVVCHDPHSEENVNQLRKLEDVELKNGMVVRWGGRGKICMDCHQSRRNAEEYTKQYSARFSPHYGNQTDMVAGTNAITFGRYLPSSTHRNALDDGCVSCHMAETPGVDQPGHDALGGHSWAMKTQDGQGNEIDFVQPCQRCHGDIASFDDILAREDHDGDKQIESAREELHGLLDVVGELLPPEGPSVVVTQAYTPLQLKAAYNYLFVEEDGSEGMHNYQYAIGLLKVSRDVLTYGVLTAGKIEKVKDVPNDQGKQVTVSWSRFGGDGPSDDPVQMYYIWRRIDGTTAAPKNARVVASLDNVSLDAATAVGTVADFGDGLWTVVGAQPAARMERYAAVVPTLADSTQHGLHYSAFVVSGHTAINSVYAVSAPDSAYSIDNLIPSAPSGVSATVRDASVVLTWNELPDPDIDYVAVYRSTGTGREDSFEPLAKISGTEYIDIAINPGQRYVYKVVAYDYTGNQGVFSAPAETSISTGVEAMTGGIPTTYVLGQNYPNPFNPSTQISFGLPEAAQVRISVYDISGREVGVVVDQYMAAGRYQASWKGDELASGVYLYRMQAGNFVQARTMMLLK